MLPPSKQKLWENKCLDLLQMLTPKHTYSS